MSVLLLLTATDVPPLWSDAFNDVDPAPLAARSGFTITDTGVNLGTDGSFLVAAGGGANWGNTSIYKTASVARTLLGAAAAVFRFPVNAGTIGLFLASTLNPTNPLTADRGLYYNYPDLRVVGVTNNTLQRPGTRLYMIDYLFCCFPRVGGGMLYAVSGGQFGAFPQATVVWVDDDDSTDPVFVGVANGSGVQRVDYWRGLAASGISLAQRFGQALAAFQFSTAAGNANGYVSEVGAKALTVWTGTGTTTGGKLQSTTTATMRARFTPASQPRVWKATFVTPATITGAEIYLDFRDNGTNRLSAVLDTTHAYLFSSYTAATLNQNGGVTLQASTTYRLAVYDWNSEIAFYINDVLWCSATSADGAGQVQGGVSTVGQVTTVDDLACWPASVTLPAGLGGMVPPVAPTGGALVSDTFTNTAATALTTHNANWSNQAYSGGGTPTYQIDGTGTKARQSGANDIGGFAIWGVAMASVDHSVSVDVTMPAALGAGNDFNGAAVVRWTDNGNYIAARFLNQASGANCEIEVWQHVANVTTLIVAAQIAALAANSVHTVTLAVKGGVVSAYYDGVEVGKGATTLLTGTKVGFGIEASPTTGTSLFDNFAAKAVV